MQASGFRRGLFLMDRGGAPCGEVRVSYFDPQTGERRDAPAMPNEPKRKEGWGGRGPRKAVTVDGVRYPTIRAAARSIGVTEQHMSSALRKGAGSIKGHAVEYAEVAR